MAHRVATSTPCFRLGTHIHTPRGDVAIETLRSGDAVTTISGEVKVIRWVGQQCPPAAFRAVACDVLPIRVRPNAFGEGMPTRDLWVSPSCALWVDGVMIPAEALVNEISILQEETPDEVSYFHLDFDAHEVIMAEGMPAESYVDDATRDCFDNAAEFHAAHPDAVSGSAGFCAPRVDEGVTLEYVRTRVAERAATLARTFAAIAFPCAPPHYGDAVSSAHI